MEEALIVEQTAARVQQHIRQVVEQVCRRSRGVPRPAGRPGRGGAAPAPFAVGSP